VAGPRITAETANVPKNANFVRAVFSLRKSKTLVRRTTYTRAIALRFFVFAYIYVTV
jgi:hypothetical protein